MEEIIREVIYSLQGMVMTENICEEAAQQLLMGLGEYQEFDESRDFYTSQPIPEDD